MFSWGGSRARRTIKISLALYSESSSVTSSIFSAF
jgi:hypothetical protein